MYVLAILFLPGTFIHEVAHFLTALVLLVPVGQPEFLPEAIEGNKIKLGSVPIAKTDPLRRFLIGIAPLIFGIGLIYFTINFTLSKNLIGEILPTILVGYIIFQISNTMFVSRKDMEEAWKLLVILIILAIILRLVTYKTGSDVNFLKGIQLPESITNSLKQIFIFLLAPITIDALILLVTKSRKT